MVGQPGRSKGKSFDIREGYAVIQPTIRIPVLNSMEFVLLIEHTGLHLIK